MTAEVLLFCAALLALPPKVEFDYEPLVKLEKVEQRRNEQ